MKKYSVQFFFDTIIENVALTLTVFGKDAKTAYNAAKEKFDFITKTSLRKFHNSSISNK